MQKSWGIYKGFNPQTNLLHKWKEPKPVGCQIDLKPRIDWWSSGGVEFDFRAKQRNKALGKWLLAIFILIGTRCIFLGIFAATMGMWLPSI